jgi:Na+-translocating ferredoxin:NAD+ oxidoreductase subunit B
VRRLRELWRLRVAVEGGATLNRRDFFRSAVRGASAIGLGGVLLGVIRRAKVSGTVWQIDPWKCTQCGKCATECVLELSAVKCVHSFDMCGYCQLCTGYFEPQPNRLNTAAENQLCPTGAIERQFIEDPYYEYTINEPLCVGCAKCVKGCTMFGNGSLHLQIRHDRCVNCNDCSIARACPADAIHRVPVSQPYRFKHREMQA